MKTINGMGERKSQLPFSPYVEAGKACNDLKEQIFRLHALLFDDRINACSDEVRLCIGDIIVETEAVVSSITDRLVRFTTAACSIREQ
jgi:hypothetical protein